MIGRKFNIPKSPIRRLLGLLKNRTAPAINASEGGGAELGGAKGPSSAPAQSKHSALGDMPSDVNSDHDGRYYTKTLLSSTSNGEGASLIGIEDVAGNFTAEDAEGALAELAASGSSSYWGRTGTELTPATSGDNVDVSASMGANDASIYGTNTSGTNGAAGVRGKHGASLLSYAGKVGVWGESDTGAGVYGASSSGPGVYAISNTGTSLRVLGSSHLDNYFDLDGQGSAPANPSSGDLRVYGLSTDDRLYMRDDAGNVHDLGARTMWWPWPDLRPDTQIASGAHSPAAPDVTLAEQKTVDYSNLEVDDAYGSAEWISAWDGVRLTQSDAAWFLPFYWGGNSLTARCRVYVNNTSRFDHLYLVVSDEDGDGDSTSVDMLTSMSNATWYNGTLDVDTSGYTGNLRIAIFAFGTTNTGNVGLTGIRIEGVGATVWAN